MALCSRTSFISSSVRTVVAPSVGVVPASWVDTSGAEPAVASSTLLASLVAASSSRSRVKSSALPRYAFRRRPLCLRSEEHTSELQSRQYLVCRLLLEKKKKTLILYL